MSDTDDDFEDIIEEVTEEAGANRTERVKAVASVTPIHAAGGKRIKRPRGRPRKVASKPTQEALKYHKEMTEAQAKFVEEDELVKAAKGHSEPGVMLRNLHVRLLEIASALDFQAVENSKMGRDTAQIRSRQVTALREAANIEMELQKRGADVIDLKGEKFQKIFRLWITTLKDVVTEVVEPEKVDLLFNRLETEFANWEDRANDLVR